MKDTARTMQANFESKTQQIEDLQEFEPKQFVEALF